MGVQGRLMLTSEVLLTTDKRLSTALIIASSLELSMFILCDRKNQTAEIKKSRLVYKFNFPNSRFLFLPGSFW